MLRQRPVLLVVGAVACLTACSGTLDVDEPALTGATAETCRALVEDLPSSVGDEERRDVDSDLVAAYGDPAIVVTCGVRRPDELMTNCMSVNGIDWFAPDTEINDPEADVTLTTVGRDPNVRVFVPAGYRTLDSVLVDVAAPISEHTSSVEPCLGPGDDTGSG